MSSISHSLPVVDTTLIQTLDEHKDQLFCELMNSIKKKKDRKFVDLVPQVTDLNKQDNLGNTALHTAIKVGFYTAAESLIYKGIDLNVANDAGETSLEMAVKKILVKEFQEITYLNKLDEIQKIIRVLYDYKSGSSKKKIESNLVNITKLDLLKEVVNLLLRRGAEVKDELIDFCFSWIRLHCSFSTDDFIKNLKNQLQIYK